MAYTQRLTVRFDDVDYARIVYFPKLFVYCHWAFEDFIGKEAGVSYAELLGKRRLGFPAVHAQADFRHPLRFGDEVRIVMDTIKLGKRSLSNRYRLYAGDTPKLCTEVELVHVTMDLDEYKLLDIPEDLRLAFLNHLVGYTSA